MTEIRIQFWIKYRGTVDVYRKIDSKTAIDNLAHYAIHEALSMFNKRWPGTRKNELHCCGITNGKQTINSEGQRVT